MAAPHPAPPNGAQSLREVRRGVAEAPDAQVLQVVRMVDALEVRGASDDVLAPVRPRLRAIQPARPLRFARLMFMPADPLIIASPLWRPGTPFLPRSALMVLSRAVRARMRADDAAEGLADTLAQTDALIAGATTTQADIVRQAGTALWAVASIMLRHVGGAPSAACLAEWQAESLPVTELAPLALALSGILGVALALYDHEHGGPVLEESGLAAMLAGTQALGPRAWGMMLSLLVIRVPHATSALLADAQRSRDHRLAADAATEAALAWVEVEAASQVAGVSAGAATELNRQTTLLETLTDQMQRSSGDAAPRKRVAQARATLLAGALQRFEASLHERVAAPLRSLPQTPEARDDALDAMEATARTLRAFDLEARRLGGGPKFDEAVRKIALAVECAAGLCPMDKARLLEILAGPDVAMRQFDAVND
jgi:hypothetical protein